MGKVNQRSPLSTTFKQLEHHIIVNMFRIMLFLKRLNRQRKRKHRRQRRPGDRNRATFSRTVELKSVHEYAFDFVRKHRLCFLLSTADALCHVLRSTS